MAKLKKVKISGGFYTLSPERQKTTKYVQYSSGLLGGRKVVPRKQSDHTNVIRLTKNVDVNHDGRITSQDLHKGEIIGRTSSSVKPKQVVVMRHYRNGIAVKKHTRGVR